MKQEVWDAIERIGEARVRNPATIFVFDNKMKSWTEMGSDADIAYKLYGRYNALELDGDFLSYVHDELANVITTKQLVEDEIKVPAQFSADYKDKVIDELTGKVNKSLFCGATIIQIKTFLHKQQVELNEGTYGQWKDRKN